MEILAPAGTREALERAQAAGADAVYLGYAAFSARAGAGNFNDEELADALRFAHLHRMRVYVTVNTLVKDGELAEVEKLLIRLEAAHRTRREKNRWEQRALRKRTLQRKPSKRQSIRYSISLWRM